MRRHYSNKNFPILANEAKHEFRAVAAVAIVISSVSIKSVARAQLNLAKMKEIQRTKKKESDELRDNVRSHSSAGCWFGSLTNLNPQLWVIYFI